MSETGLALGLTGARSHADPLEFAVEGLLPGARLLLLEGQAVLLLLEPARVVAFPGDALAAVEFEDPARHVVQEVAVMRDRHDRALVLLQMTFEPGDRFGVEMVRGLVEQKQVRSVEQKPAQRDPALLAARELRDLGIARRQAERVHRHVEVGIEIPQVLRIDHVLQSRELIRGLVRVVRREFVVAGEDLPLGGDRHLHVLAHVLGGIEHRLLGQETDLHPLGREGLAREVLVFPGHDAEQGRLSRAVRSEDADLGARVEREPDPFQEFLALRGDFPQVLHCEHVLSGHLFSSISAGVHILDRPARDTLTSPSTLFHCPPRFGVDSCPPANFSYVRTSPRARPRPSPGT